MPDMTPDAHAHCVRSEMSTLALRVHRLANDAGGDLHDALTALADMEQEIAGARKGLLELPKLKES